MSVYKQEDRNYIEAITCEALLQAVIYRIANTIYILKIKI